MIFYLPVSKLTTLFKYKKSSLIRTFYTFLSKKWHFDQIANELIIHRLMLFGDKVSFQLLDKGNIERYGPFGIAFSAHNASIQASIFHSGSIAHYLLIITVAIISALFLYSLQMYKISVTLTFLLLTTSYCFFCFLFNYKNNSSF